MGWVEDVVLLHIIVFVLIPHMWSGDGGSVSMRCVLNIEMLLILYTRFSLQITPLLS